MTSSLVRSYALDKAHTAAIEYRIEHNWRPDPKDLFNLARRYSYEKLRIPVDIEKPTNDARRGEIFAQVLGVYEGIPYSMVDGQLTTMRDIPTRIIIYDHLYDHPDIKVRTLLHEIGHAVTLSPWSGSPLYTGDRYISEFDAEYFSQVFGFIADLVPTSEGIGNHDYVPDWYDHHLPWHTQIIDQRTPTLDRLLDPVIETLIEMDKQA